MREEREKVRRKFFETFPMVFRLFYSILSNLLALFLPHYNFVGENPLDSYEFSFFLLVSRMFLIVFFN